MRFRPRALFGPLRKDMPNLYRRVQVVMTDGATYWVPSATRLVTNLMQLERDPANHPVFLVRAARSTQTRPPPRGASAQPIRGRPPRVRTRTTGRGSSTGERPPACSASHSETHAKCSASDCTQHTVRMFRFAWAQPALWGIRAG
eukprot:199986-Prymnesium_polylepis.1